MRPRNFSRSDVGHALRAPRLGVSGAVRHTDGVWRDRRLLRSGNLKPGQNHGSDQPRHSVKRQGATKISPSPRCLQLFPSIVIHSQCPSHTPWQNAVKIPPLPPLIAALKVSG